MVCGPRWLVSWFAGHVLNKTQLGRSMSCWSSTTPMRSIRSYIAASSRSAKDYPPPRPATNTHTHTHTCRPTQTTPSPCAHSCSSSHLRVTVSRTHDCLLCLSKVIELTEELLREALEAGPSSSAQPPGAPSWRAHSRAYPRLMPLWPPPQKRRASPHSCHRRQALVLSIPDYHISTSMLQPLHSSHAACAMDLEPPACRDLARGSTSSQLNHS